MNQLPLPFSYPGQEVLDASNITKFDDLLQKNVESLEQDAHLTPPRLGVLTVNDERSLKWTSSRSNYDHNRNLLVKALKSADSPTSPKGHFRCDVCDFCCTVCDLAEDYDLCFDCEDRLVDTPPPNYALPAPNASLENIYVALRNLMPKAQPYGFTTSEPVRDLNTTCLPISYEISPLGDKEGNFAVTALYNFASVQENTTTHRIDNKFYAFFPSSTNKERRLKELFIVVHMAYTSESGSTTINWDQSLLVAWSPSTNTKVGFPLCYIMDGHEMPPEVKSHVGDDGVAIRLALKQFVNPTQLFAALDSNYDYSRHETKDSFITKIQDCIRNNMVFKGPSKQIFDHPESSVVPITGVWHVSIPCSNLISRKLSGTSPKEEIAWITANANKDLGSKLFKLYLQTVQKTYANTLRALVEGTRHTRYSNNRHCNVCTQLDIYQNLSRLFKAFKKTLNYNNIKELTDVMSLNLGDITRWHSIEGLCESNIFHSLSEQRKLSILKSVFEEKVIVGDAANRIWLSDTVNTLRSIEQRPTDDIKEARQQLKGKDIRSIKLFHDELVYIHNALKTKPIKINPDFYQFLEGKTKVDRYEIKIPRSNLDVVTWGQIQSHCIGTYASQAVEGTSLLLGVWDTENDKWFGHLSMSPIVRPGFFLTDKVSMKNQLVISRTVKVSQFYGRSNSGLEPEEKTKIIEHLQKCVNEWFEDLAESLNLKTPDDGIVTINNYNGYVNNNNNYGIGNYHVNANINYHPQAVERFGRIHRY